MKNKKTPQELGKELVESSAIAGTMKREAQSSLAVGSFTITSKICRVKDKTDNFKITSIENFKTGYCVAVADSARASFKKSADDYTAEKNNGLVDYLKEHNHKSPFFHAEMVFALQTIEWQNFIIYAMNNPKDGFMHQDDLSSIKYYQDKTSPAEPFTYIKISCWFYNRLVKYAKHCDFNVNVADNFDRWKFEAKERHSADKINNLNLCIFNPTSEWLMSRKDILEASRLITFNVLVETPLFVFNQLVKHRKAEVNTRSFRFVKDAELEFYQPEKWRKQSENNKQGSKVDEFVDEKLLNIDIKNGINIIDIINKTGLIEAEAKKYLDAMKNIIENAIIFTKDIEGIADDINNWYKTQIKNEMAGEQARFILPQSTFTSFVWTFSLNTFASIVKQRISPDSQLETQEVVQEVLNLVKTRYPEFDKVLELFLKSNY